MTAGYLPEGFLEDREPLLGNQFPEFLCSFGRPRTYGLRVNTLKVSPDQYLSMAPMPLEPVPWCSSGFYYDGSRDRPGLHPHHDAGLYYIQEPSAMAVVPAMDIQPGQWVLDLCSAPGGKASQIAALLQGQGLLVANDVYPGRMRSLAQNLERMGVIYALAVLEQPHALAKAWPQLFDRVLVDAPCSGEGMFRKDEEAAASWSREKVSRCAAEQRRLLQAAYTLLKPGGVLGYSTCTFSREENEQQTETLLKNCPDLSLVREKRFWPHLHACEGHYCAVLEKAPGSHTIQGQPWRLQEKLSAEQRRHLAEFEARHLQPGTLPPEGAGVWQVRGDDVYWMPASVPPLRGVRLVQGGLHVGTLKKGRFEPAHGLAMVLRSGQTLSGLHLAADEPQVRQYLQGQVLPGWGSSGWGLVCCDGFGLGWAKEAQGQWKNHYPRGLRRP